jgi:hypothetical protein
MPEQQSREAERKLGQSCISQAVSDYKASLSAGSEKHVRFNEQVEQCFALEITGDENEEDGWYATEISSLYLIQLSFCNSDNGTNDLSVSWRVRHR